MDESWLSAFKKDPPADWAETLRVRLRESEMPNVLPDISNRWPLRRLIATLALIVLAVGIFTVPALRASAISFLALFRVVNFVAVPVDPGRLRALDESHRRPLAHILVTCITRQVLRHSSTQYNRSSQVSTTDSGIGSKFRSEWPHGE